MNQLELVRRARPDVAPLDAATRARIAGAVFGDDVPAPPPAGWPKIVLAVAAVALVAGGVATVSRRSSTTRPVQPVASQPLTSRPSVLSPATTTTTLPATTTTTAPRPSNRFLPTAEYGQRQLAALDAFMQRCMTDAGFTYTGKPFQTDSEVADAMPAQPDTYVAAWFGVDGNGGCLHQAYSNMFGQVRADVIGSNLQGQLQGTWTRTALAEPGLHAQLDELTDCAAQHGIDVTNLDSRSNHALDDILSPLIEMAKDRAGLGNDYVEMARLDAAVDELCPTYSGFRAALRDGIERAAAAWIDANPQQMADLDAEYADDMTRFQYIIDHDGELPPS